MELFNSLCKLSLYGKNDEITQEMFNVPLHRCDIYGSKKAGKKLQYVFSIILKTSF